MCPTSLLPICLSGNPTNGPEVCIKVLGNFWISASYAGLRASAMALPFVFVMPQSALDIALFCSLGLLGGAGQYLVIRAFQSGPAAVIAPLGYVELIGTTILGYAIFGNFPDLWTWIGAAVIIASGLYIALRGLPATRTSLLQERAPGC